MIKRCAPWQALITLASLSSMPLASPAVELQPSRFYESLTSWAQFPEGDETTPESISVNETLEDVGNAHGVASTAGGTRPRGQVDFTLNVQPGSLSLFPWDVSGEASIRYYWAIEQIGGPAWNELVPVDIVTAGSTSFSVDTVNGIGVTNMYADILFDTSGDSNRSFSATPCGGPFCEPGTYSFDEAFTVQTHPNVANRVQMVAFIGAALWDGSLVASAWIDPIIRIDPDFARAADFQIVFSNDVTPIPLPPALLLLGSGLLFVTRRARSVA